MGLSCSFCGAAFAHKRCGSCRSVAYCSVECQKSDWKEHKLACFKPGKVPTASESLEPTQHQQQQQQHQSQQQQVASPAASGVCDVAATILEDTVLGRNVLQYLDPLSSYEATSAVSSQLQAACAVEDVWHALLDEYPQRDPLILDVKYTGQIFSGRRRVAHVQGAVAANYCFYTYFATGRCSRSQIDALIDETSTVIHPGSICSQGEPATVSWYHVLGASHEKLPLTCIRQRWRVDDSLAVVVCGEDFGTNIVEATNVFECKKGKWRMVHHQGGHSRNEFR
ncbi:unnamed protein product [Polarella glacialis]|uniref:MYND-type domain-containing protein n=1 Tax=Polarella glacialis TaxID=89957 RepID=A0A813EN87_POLGL|nr:unnamed protein product [Polarella glacialis]CAE8652016.1 unnamed protein product [Polarella glacialis]